MPDNLAKSFWRTGTRVRQHGFQGGASNMLIISNSTWIQNFDGIRNPNPIRVNDAQTRWIHRLYHKNPIFLLYFRFSPIFHRPVAFQLNPISESLSFLGLNLLPVFFPPFSCILLISLFFLLWRFSVQGRFRRFWL